MAQEERKQDPRRRRRPQQDETTEKGADSEPKDLQIALPHPFATKVGADAVEGEVVTVRAEVTNTRKRKFMYTMAWDSDIPVSKQKKPTWEGSTFVQEIELDTAGQNPGNHLLSVTVDEWEPTPDHAPSRDWGDVFKELEPGEDEDEGGPGTSDDYVAGRSLPPIAGASDGVPAGHTRVRTARALGMLRLSPRPVGHGDVLPVALRRTQIPATADQALWSTIRNSALTWAKYSRFMDIVMCGEPPGEHALEDAELLHLDDAAERRPSIQRRLRLPYPDVDAYRQLKVATEVFMMVNCGVVPSFRDLPPEELAAETRRYGRALRGGDIERLWQQLLAQGGRIAGDVDTLPYLALVRRKLKDVQVVTTRTDGTFLQPEEVAAQCYDILLDKLTHPCLLELMWSYWHEEGMLVQTLNAISWRFQNRRGPGDRDPLALVEIDPLRPLNNFLWGYVQDEEHRLTVPRRAYEYDHHYGITLRGKAVPAVYGADSRSRFLEAFHHLLHVCGIFFKEDDDTTVVADAFPVLNALKEVHLLLTQGAHNQYGDLPWTARQEMLMQQWLMARPEFREFLPRRIMVDYPEEWMDSVETMKTLQGWSSASIMHFRDLGVFGEQILLGVRFGAWPSVIESEQAGNWARYWRPEIQGYIHGYRAVTGVDLSERVDATMPSALLARRMMRTTRGQLGVRTARELPGVQPVVQAPIPSELQEWGQPRP